MLVLEPLALLSGPVAGQRVMGGRETEEQSRTTAMVARKEKRKRLESHSPLKDPSPVTYRPSLGPTPKVTQPSPSTIPGSMPLTHGTSDKLQQHGRAHCETPRPGRDVWRSRPRTSHIRHLKHRSFLGSEPSQLLSSSYFETHALLTLLILLRRRS